MRLTSTDRLLARSGVRKNPRIHFAAFNSTFLLDQYHILPNKVIKSQCLMGLAGVFVQGRFVRPTPADPLLQRRGAALLALIVGLAGKLVQGRYTSNTRCSVACYLLITIVL